MCSDEMRDEARKPFLSLFIDGRNEYGSHVLTVPGDRISDDEIVSDFVAVLEDQDTGIAEQIITDAEAMGFSVGHCVTTIGSIQNDSGALGDSYFEYERISWPLTVLLHGTPEEQQAAIEAMEYT